MKNYAQAILQFTGYPLEPIVALQINKVYQSHLQGAFTNSLFNSAVVQTGIFVTARDMDERWFSNYE